MINDKGQLFAKRRFLVDDMHRRSIEGDMLMPQILHDTVSTQRVPGHLLLISATPNPSIVVFVGRCQAMTVRDERPFTIRHQRVECRTSAEIMRDRVLQRATADLRAWGSENPPYPVETMLIFTASAKLGPRLADKRRRIFEFRGRPLFGAREDAGFIVKAWPGGRGLAGAAFVASATV